MHHETEELLTNFMKIANKEALHVLDYQKFHRFIISAHIFGDVIDATDLRARLEKERFPHGEAARLATLYIDGRHLLTEYTKAKSG